MDINISTLLRRHGCRRYVLPEFNQFPRNKFPLASLYLDPLVSVQTTILIFLRPITRMFYFHLKIAFVQVRGLGDARNNESCLKKDPSSCIHHYTGAWRFNNTPGLLEHISFLRDSTSMSIEHARSATGVSLIWSMHNEE